MTADASPGPDAERPRPGPLFNCPRCHRPTEAELYGPCPTCVTDLRARYAGLAREVEAPEYAPKLNVTPNAVALRDE